MGETIKRQLALDTNVLIDLAEENVFAHTFRELLQQRGYSLRVPPTVVQELAYSVETEDNHSRRSLIALSQMRK